MADGRDLPAGWTSHVDVQSVIYYTNSVTGETTYEKPEALPEGWQEAKDEEGKIYFYNATTGESSWDRPHVSAAVPGGKLRCRHLLVKFEGSKNPLSRRTGESTEGLTAEAAQADLQQYVDLIVSQGSSEELFAQYAEMRSDCGTYADGGDLGEFIAGSGDSGMPDEFEAAAGATPVGTMSGIILSSAGYHLIFRTG